MKKQLLLICSLFFILVNTHAQLTLTLQVPSSGVLVKPQLWNAVVTSSYTDIKQVFIGITLSDATTGEPILTATTIQFAIETGAVQVNESNLSPIYYEYLSSRVIDRSPEGYLPAGMFTACYTVFIVQENEGSPVAEECIPITVEPVSPPVLNTPFDQDVLQTHYPQFTWIPPTPPEIFSNLGYDFVLVEVQSGQSAGDAIQQNLPLYTTNQPDLFLNYPSSLNALDTGKMYAWQITAKNGNEYAAQSEIWTFSIAEDSILPPPIEINNPYVRLKKELDASISVANDTLKISYNNDPSDSAISYEMAGIDDDANQILITDSILLKPGDNLLNFPLNGNLGFVASRLYEFRLYNSRNEIWSIKFIFQPKNQ